MHLVRLLGIEFQCIDVEVDQSVMDQRLKSWKPRETNYNSGAIWKFAQGVGPAHKGADALVPSPMAEPPPTMMGKPLNGLELAATSGTPRPWWPSLTDAGTPAFT